MKKLKPIGRIDEEGYLWFTDNAKYSDIPYPDKLYSGKQLKEKIKEIKKGPQQCKGLKKLLEEVEGLNE